jgi:hypothetical protein
MEHAAMNETTYFWAATLTWRTSGGTVTWSKSASFATDATVSRGKVLADVLKAAGAPADVAILFFSVEPDEVQR